MNEWTQHKVAIVEADDFCDLYSRNGLNYLFYWKTAYPNFKITLFTIPNRTSKAMLDLLYSHRDWIELAMHGWDHESNFECWTWDYEKTCAYIDRVRSYNAYVSLFKAPGWTITDKYCGYTADVSLPVSGDPQAAYRAMKDKDMVVVDRHYNKPARPEGAKIICIDCNPDIIHMHTWDMVTGDHNAKNGFGQVQELHGVPWDNTTQFYTVWEAWEKGLILPCTK